MTQLHFSTSNVSPSDRSNFWSSVIRPVYEISSFNGDTNAILEGEIWSCSAGPLTIGATSFNQQRYQRDRRLIGLTDLDFHLVQFITEGTLRGDFDGRDVSAKPGDIVIIDLSRPVKSEVSIGKRITTTIPREALNRVVTWRNIHGTVLSGRAPATRLIAHFLKGVYKIAAELSPKEGAATQDAMIKLFASSLNSLTDPCLFDEGATTNHGLKEAIIQYIEQNLASSSLDVASVQKRFNISRSHLYRLFEPENGVSGFIKGKRLDHVVRELARQQKRSVTAKELAYHYGFDSPEAFSKQFRERFGMSPKEMAQADHLASMKIGRSFDLHRHIRTQVLTAAQIINNLP